jgi:hypothetical protein
VSDALAEWASGDVDEDVIADMMQIHRLSVLAAAREGFVAATKAKFAELKFAKKLADFRKEICYGFWYFDAALWDSSMGGHERLRGRGLSPLSRFSRLGKLCEDLTGT